MIIGAYRRNFVAIGVGSDNVFNVLFTLWSKSCNSGGFAQRILCPIIHCGLFRSISILGRIYRHNNIRRLVMSNDEIVELLFCVFFVSVRWW